MDVAALVERARVGDADAYTCLVQRYQAMAFGYAYASLGDFHLAEDAAQQAFVTAWRRLAHLEHPERFGGWLRGIVRFECLRLLRAGRSRETPLDATDPVVASTPGPEELAMERDGVDRLFAAISALPRVEREVTILHYVHDRPQRDVAEFLGIPVTTVNNRLRSARTRLKAERLLTMTSDAFQRHDVPKGFAERIGQIIRTDGALFDVRFAPTHRPAVLNAVTVTDEAAGIELTAEVAQHLDDDLVRCIAVNAPGLLTGSLHSGMTVVDTAVAIKTPLDHASIRRVIASMKRAASDRKVLETGIKAIDAFCPIPAGGVVALTGDMQTGKMVLVEELIQRLGNNSPPVSILVFVEALAEVATIRELDYRTSASVHAIYLPVEDPSAEALAQLTANCDAVIALSRELGAQGLYPAIDPLRSNSTLLDPDVVGEKHVQVASEGRDLLERAAHVSADDETAGGTSVRVRAGRVRRFLTQPFYVAEAFTNRPGVFVTREEAIAGCQALIQGEHDDLAEDDLYMAGSLESIRAGR
ncbi:MAG: ATP synthase beta chain [uncultured Thermomicrobiales bacterium]|uniref:ATP synthase beta chain n=1 Tax=uncultured Thermomicrobiales bacterium TaxID=1645740 RepID=A0A6J4UXV1_9BACT|nr:MAG: ATP synthase beta chain [uncultured Thermomicrobiales bacterium]